MRPQNLRLSKIQRRKNVYSSKKSKQKHNQCSSNSSSVLTLESLYDSSDELVCTNCVERDYYLAQFCNELLFSPSAALRHLDGLINNPEFPKGDLYLSDVECPSSQIGQLVPVTTYTCMDCNPLDERIPPRPVDVPKSHFMTEDEMKCSWRYSNTVTKNAASGNYEKQRREMEREIIDAIYELVCPPELNVSNGRSGCSSVSGGGTRTTPRVTKLTVSEMAIERMENIKKINYNSQIERIKYKLLQSYRAFKRLDEYVSSVTVGGGVDGVVSHVMDRVPYEEKIRDLEKSLRL